MRQLIYISLIAFVLVGCIKEAAVPPPGRTRLIFPEANALCTSGTIISDTESKLTFKWTAAQNADGYDMIVKNLLTGELETYSTDKNEYEASLLRATPYAWFIKATSTKTAAVTSSDTTKFYNAGAANITYAPYPADILFPLLAQAIPAGSGKITLDWDGADVDNDITTYDIYFGTTPTPPALKLNLTDSKLADVPVTAGNTYYWKIVTHDSEGNVSDSGVFLFFVN
nr:hypothetical protein [uncultured Mucilaginibacter sp.]